MILQVLFSDNNHPTRSNCLDTSTNENAALDQISLVLERESVIPLSERAPDSDIPSLEEDRRDSSITQNYTTTKSGDRIIKPKKLLVMAILGLLSSQIRNLVNNQTENLHNISIFKAQLEYYQIVNTL